MNVMHSEYKLENKAEFCAKAKELILTDEHTMRSFGIATMVGNLSKMIDGCGLSARACSEPLQTRFRALLFFLLMLKIT